MYEINETHDPNLKSWVESANDLETDFPIQNLPFCTYKSPSFDGRFSCGVAIGDQILDLMAAVELELIPKPVGAWSRDAVDYYWSIGNSLMRLFTP